MAFGDFPFVAKGRGEAEGEGAFLGVAEGDVGHGGEGRSDGDGEGFVVLLGELIGALFFEEDLFFMLPFEVDGE